jgi:hypothetical protein
VDVGKAEGERGEEDDFEGGHGGEEEEGKGGGAEEEFFGYGALEG